jgi:cytoskeleton protein RodZ
MNETVGVENESGGVYSTKSKLGEIFVENRELQNLTIDDVSNRLRLSPRQIKALETNDFSVLPEPMMTRGFIRNYARLLGIEAEPLLAAYLTLKPNDVPSSIYVPSANILISGRNNSHWFKYILASGLVVLLLGAWVIYNDYIPHNTVKLEAGNSKAVEPKTSESVVAEPMPEPALPAAERVPDSTEGDTITSVAMPSADATKVISPVATSPAAPVAPVANSAAETASVASQQKPLPNVLLKVKFNFTEQTWLSVTDRDNKEIFNKTKAAGSQDEIEGQPPLKIFIGNARGSQVIYNDKVIDLAPYTKSNVAHLTLALE